jgi:hypothetical protein
MAVDDEDPDGSPQTSSVPSSILISTDNVTLAMCIAELRALERFLDVGDDPLDHTAIKKTLDNLEGIKEALDVTARLACDFQPHIRIDGPD